MGTRLQLASLMKSKNKNGEQARKTQYATHSNSKRLALPQYSVSTSEKHHGNTSFNRRPLRDMLSWVTTV